MRYDSFTNRVLVAGPRDFIDVVFIDKLIQSIADEYEQVVIIEGGAPGADTLARKSALSRGIPVMEFPAAWDKFHRGAGRKRNEWMIDLGVPNVGYCIRYSAGWTPGTRMMYDLLKASGIRRNVVKYSSR